MSDYYMEAEKLAEEVSTLRQQLAEAKKDAERLKAIEAAARNLVKVKGRFHSEVAMNVLIAVLHGDQAMRDRHEQNEA